MINNGDRKNDIRRIIPTLKAGDPITESWLKAVSDALNDRRPFSNPPSQVIPKNGTRDHVINAASWTFVSLAAPGVVQEQNVHVKASSDTNNSFTGTSAGFKGIINFERNVTVSGSQLSQLGISIGSSGVQFTGNLTGSSTAAASFSGSAAIRVTPITASFVTNTLTWNNVVVTPSITLGTAFSTIFVGNAGIILGGGTAAVLTSMTGSWPSTAPAILGLYSSVTSFSCYGMMVEIEPVFGTPPSGLTLSSTSATLTSINYSSSTVCKQPYLVLPAA